jgi:hypothetical protein
MERVRPSLKHAFRADASALESKQKAHDAKIHALILAQGMSEQVTYDETGKKWGLEALLRTGRDDAVEALRRSYDDQARSLFESLSGTFPSTKRTLMTREDESGISSKG